MADFGCPSPSARRAVLNAASLDPVALKVLWQISEALDRQGTTWICRATIAKRSGVSERTVRTVTSWARAEGVLVVWWREGHRHMRLNWRRLREELPARTAGARKRAKTRGAPPITGEAPAFDDGGEAPQSERGAPLADLGRPFAPLGAPPITQLDHANSDHESERDPREGYKRSARGRTPLEAPHQHPKEEPADMSYLDLFPELAQEAATGSPAHSNVVSLPSPRLASPPAPQKAPTSPPAPHTAKPAPPLPTTRAGRPNLAVIGTPYAETEPALEEPMLVYGGTDGYPVEDPLSPGDVVYLPPTLQELLSCAPGNGIGWISKLRAKGVTTTADLYGFVDSENVRFTLGGALGEAVSAYLTERWGAPLLSPAQREEVKAKRELAALMARKKAIADAKAEQDQRRAREDEAGVVRLGEVRYAR